MRRSFAGAAFLLAIALLAVGCSRVASDSQIATHIKASFHTDPQLKGSSLKVAVKSGVATLTGDVPSVAARYEAFKLASETTGVKKVDDDMSIAQAPAKTQAAAVPPPASPPAPESHILRHKRVIRPPQPAPEQTAASTVPSEAPPSLPHPPLPSAAVAMKTAPVQPAPPPPEIITIPQGTPVSVRMIDSASSGENHVGDILHASLAKRLVVRKQLVAPRGSDVYLRVVEVHSAGHFGGRSELRLELYRIVIHGTSYPLISNDYVDKAPSRTKRAIMTILGSSAVGAAIGAIAGGGKGAAIGAAAGGGGGAIYEGATKSKQVNIAPETLLKFKLEQPASVTVKSNLPQAKPQP